MLQYPIQSTKNFSLVRQVFLWLGKEPIYPGNGVAPDLGQVNGWQLDGVKDAPMDIVVPEGWCAFPVPSGYAVLELKGLFWEDLAEMFRLASLEDYIFAYS
jgi:hypothetical protein